MLNGLLLNDDPWFSFELTGSNLPLFHTMTSDQNATKLHFLYGHCIRRKEDFIDFDFYSEMKITRIGCHHSLTGDSKALKCMADK